MKEDILEQLVDDYLQAKGYFTMHNVKFYPLKTAPDYVPNDDRVASDVDVVGFHPKLQGPEQVWIVSCKSWQSGFDPTHWISCIDGNRIINGRAAWKPFRELAKKKWADGLMARIKELTGAQSFTYVTAVTKLKGEHSKWIEHEIFRQNLCGNPILVLTLEKILEYLYENLSTTVAPSEVGRLLQVMKASGWKQPQAVHERQRASRARAQ